MTILCVITSRPSYSRIKTVLQAMGSLGVDFEIVCTSSAVDPLYGNVAKVIENDGFSVKYRLPTQVSITDGHGATKTTALNTISIADIIAFESPAAVITIADRYETIGTAIAAAYQNIPCIHIQGGEVTGNIDDKVRDAVACLSDLHFPATEVAADRLRRMLRGSSDIVNFGCPGVDLFYTAPEAERRDVLADVLAVGAGTGPAERDDYYVVMLHPDTNDVGGVVSFVERLLEFSHSNRIPLIWFWPNPDPGSFAIAKSIRRFREVRPDAPLLMVKNVKSDVFVNLLRHSSGFIGNSSVGIREVGVLGTPTANIGDRQSGRERHLNVTDFDTSTQISKVFDSLRCKPTVPCTIYGSGDSGRRIAKYIAEKYDSD